MKFYINDALYFDFLKIRADLKDKIYYDNTKRFS
jgi:hypothetical protein